MTNLRLVPDAGSDKETHLPSYISGYFDGEGLLFGGPEPSNQAEGGMGSASERVGQPEWRSRRSALGDPGLLRMRDHQARSIRSDAQVGGAQLRASPIEGVAALPAIPSPLS